VDPAATVAVIVPSWNSAGLLPRCLASLEGQGERVEVLVVDNGSSDGSAALVRERFGAAKLLELGRNLGFARAVNLGAAETRAAMVLPLNADTAMEPGAIGRLREALAADSSLGGVQPRILQLEEGEAMDAASARLYSAGQALTRDGRAFELGAGAPQDGAHLRSAEVFGVCGAACLLRRELFEELGGYDERYFAFYEDVDLNARARVAGWGFGYVPEAVVWHLGNASWQAGFARPKAENARLVARNRLATQVKLMPAAAIPRIAAVEIGSLARAASQRRLGATLRGKLEALQWLPALLGDRRRLRRVGDPARARRWLGRPAGPARPG
jgi:N-acetylglucosaminyl-diphospho-decaprenol L-rhamnosyltransferase